MDFYTSCIKWGNYILVRGIRRGKRFHDRVKYQPTLFTPVNEKTKHRTLDGRYAAPMKFDTIKEAQEWIDRYSDVDNFEFFGNTNFQYAFISDALPKDISYDKDKIHIVTIDIEVDSQDGFPEPSVADQPVTAIALHLRGSGIDHFFVYGTQDFDKSNFKNLTYFKARHEAGLLRKFLEDWKTIQPDVVTGWNVGGFDIPYLVNRIRNVFGADESDADLSPWGIVRETTKYQMGKRVQTYDLVGISVLDYLMVYKKFVPAGRESYTLNFIAETELKEGKIDYAEHGSLRELYAKDFQKFLEYNIRDVQLVARLEEKLGFLAQIFATAYDAKVNFVDVLSQVRMWDTIIYNHLRQRNYVIPQKKEKEKSTQYTGAFVKEPIAGMHDWVCSFDLNSLYPNIIVQWNISPETLRPKEFRPIEIEKLLAEEYDLSYLKDKKLAMAVNGHHFDCTEQGFLPAIVRRMYDDRVKYKKKMIAAQNRREEVLAEMNRRGISK